MEGVVVSNQIDNFKIPLSENYRRNGFVASQARSHMSGSLPLERTIEITTRTVPLNLKKLFIATAHLEGLWNN